jgi:hypothetical protein
MDDRDQIIEASERMATAIARRDVPAIRALIRQGLGRLADPRCRRSARLGQNDVRNPS